jgi:ubiquinone/menaquinone biosynthesis C-methylase UbiE
MHLRPILRVVSPLLVTTLPQTAVKPSTIPKTKEAVRDYWQAAPCGTSLTTAEPGSRAFFDEIEEARYRVEPFIPRFAEFERWHDKRVLEIGVGVGSDFVRFARAGARLSGIDLTDASIELVRRRLAMETLEAELHVADAEALPFADSSFDLVYSWGVLHHTPDPERAVNEVRRVLAMGGEARIMLYSRRSWVALGAWLRYGLLRGMPWRPFTALIGDHIESPGTKAYTQRELNWLFREFRQVRFIRWITEYDRRVAGPLVGLGGKRLGWFVGIQATH